MKKIINKIKLNGEEYIKVLNIVEDRIIHINIFHKIKENYKEIFPDEVDKNIQKQILDVKNDIPMNKEELISFTEYIDCIREKGKISFKRMLDEKGLIDSNIKVARNMAGIEYVVVQDNKLPYAELMRVNFSENGDFISTSAVPMTHTDLVIVDMIPYLTLLKRKRIIQVEKDTFYGISEDGKTIVISHMYIHGQEDDKKLSCIKAYAIKKVGKAYRLYQYDELNEEFENKVKYNVQKLMDYIINKLGWETI
ncbi:TPA: hypothetical protein N2D99_002369 [Clostridium botulinum]|nr:hypothetical protein [Clostridium botulinum]